MLLTLNYQLESIVFEEVIFKSVNKKCGTWITTAVLHKFLRSSSECLCLSDLLLLYSMRVYIRHSLRWDYLSLNSPRYNTDHSTIFFIVFSNQQLITKSEALTHCCSKTEEALSRCLIIRSTTNNDQHRLFQFCDDKLIVVQIHVENLYV